jgi:ADP-ribosylglycohydrolase
MKTVQERFLNVVLSARVGDAMGTPTEGLTADDIHEKFGWVSTYEGDGTDDSMMANILAEVLIESKGWATADEWAGKLVLNFDEIQLNRDYFFESVLHLVDKLKSGYRPSDVALGNMPSSSSAMCIWPVGLVNAANPDEAATHAYQLAGLIQVAPADHCTDAAAALASAISAAFLPGADINSCVEQALRCIRPVSGTRFRDALERAVELARHSDSYESFREEYQSTFSQPIMCDALETVPAAFGLAVLAAGDPKKAVEFGANFGRDADTIACMAGALTGALAAEFPDEWADSSSASDYAGAAKIAADLAATALEKNRVLRDRSATAAAFLETP